MTVAAEQAGPDGLADIHCALESFDGIRIAPLRAVATRVAPTDTVINDLIARCADGDDKNQIAASWLLKHYLAQGAVLDRDRAARLAGALKRLSPWQARLHLAQSFAWLDIPNDRLSTVAETLRTWVASDSRFLRAWACDALWRLGQRHQRLRQLALDTVLAAQADPAASVRARARTLLKLG